MLVLQFWFLACSSSLSPGLSFSLTCSSALIPGVLLLLLPGFPQPALCSPTWTFSSHYKLKGPHNKNSRRIPKEEIWGRYHFSFENGTVQMPCSETQLERQQDGDATSFIRSWKLQTPWANELSTDCFCHPQCLNVISLGKEAAARVALQSLAARIPLKS